MKTLSLIFIYWKKYGGSCIDSAELILIWKGNANGLLDKINLSLAALRQTPQISDEDFVTAVFLLSWNNISQATLNIKHKLLLQA